MPDEKDSKSNPEDVQAQMRAAIERIRKMLKKELERAEREKASGASAGTAPNR